jgi:alkyl hydroperoxide reductase subunit D
MGTAIDALRDVLPDSARDIKINLQTTLGDGPLTPAQKWGTAVACAIAARNPALRDATIADARAALASEEGLADKVIDDGRAAAILMGMNNVFYRFRHMIGREEYAQKPARLRMTRIAQVKTSKVDFELMCLAVSAINGCEACLRAHEKVVIDGGLTEDHVQDAVRIASTFHAAAVGLEAG